MLASAWKLATKSPEPREGFAAVGLILGPHGTGGALRVKPFNPSTKHLDAGRSVQLKGIDVRIKSMRANQDFFVINVSGIDTRTKASETKGLLLEVHEDKLEREENSWFIHEIEGLEVFDENNQFIGKLEEVLQPGANDVYMIKKDDREILIPATKEVIEEINLTKGLMKIRLENYQQDNPT